MTNPGTCEWKVEFPSGGRDGYIAYYEGPRAISFYWEVGGTDVILIIHVGKPSEWKRKHAWAADRLQEIMDRVAVEFIRQSAPNCRAEVQERDDGYVYLLVREQRST